MRVLILTPQLPYPPHQGTTLRNYNILRILAARNELTLLSFGDPNDQTNLRELENICGRVVVIAPAQRGLRHRLADLPTAHPDLARRLASPEFNLRLREVLHSEQFDVVQIEGLEMMARWQSIGTGWSGITILDEHNAEYVLQKRAFQIDCRLGGSLVGAAYSLLQWQKLRRFEARVCRAVDAVIAVSETDRLALLEIAPESRVVVVPNGVDTDFYRPMGLAAPATPTLVFTGTMDFRPNVDAMTWLCSSILPLIRKHLPEVRLRVVGQRPTPEVQRLGRIPGVEVTGWVADERPEIAGATVYVVPIRMGGGVRLKLLQAMAMAMPVVSTSLGAEGVATRSGQELLLADDEASFAAAVVSVLLDDRLRAQLALAARPAIVNRYDWRAIAPELEGLYAELGRGSTLAR